MTIAQTQTEIKVEGLGSQTPPHAKVVFDSPKPTDSSSSTPKRRSVWSDIATSRTPSISTIRTSSNYSAKRRHMPYHPPVTCHSATLYHCKPLNLTLMEGLTIVASPAGPNHPFRVGDRLVSLVVGGQTHSVFKPSDVAAALRAVKDDALAVVDVSVERRRPYGGPTRSSSEVALLHFRGLPITVRAPKNDPLRSNLMQLRTSLPEPDLQPPQPASQRGAPTFFDPSESRASPRLPQEPRSFQWENWHEQGERTKRDGEEIERNERVSDGGLVKEIRDIVHIGSDDDEVSTDNQETVVYLSAEDEC